MAKLYSICLPLYGRDGEAMKVYDATKDTLACASSVVKTGRSGQFYCYFIGFYEPNQFWCPGAQPPAHTHTPPQTLMDNSRKTDLKGLVVDPTCQHTKKLTLK